MKKNNTIKQRDQRVMEETTDKFQNQKHLNKPLFNVEIVLNSNGFNISGQLKETTVGELASIMQTISNATNHEKDYRGLFS